MINARAAPGKHDTLPWCSPNLGKASKRFAPWRGAPDLRQQFAGSAAKPCIRKLAWMRLEARKNRTCIGPHPGRTQAAERPVISVAELGYVRRSEVTEFERRQMAAVRKELDQEYAAAVGLKAKPSKDDAHFSDLIDGECL
jgi:hypothetical protein